MHHFPGAEPVMVITFIFLTIYFPWFIINKMAVGNAGISLATHKALALSVSLLLLSITFKYTHWTGAGPLLLSAFASFSLIYAPMLFMEKTKEEGANKLMYAAGILGMAVFALAIVFKIMHYPGAPIMSLASVGLVFFVFFPMYMNSASISTEKKDSYLPVAFYTIIIGVILAFHIFISILPQHSHGDDHDDSAVEQINKEQEQTPGQ